MGLPVTSSLKMDANLEHCIIDNNAIFRWLSPVSVTTVESTVKLG